MKKVILTGCAGYIGSELSKKIVGSGFKLFGVDNLRFKQNIPSIFDNKETEFILEDITKQTTVKFLIKDINPDFIIHLAGIVGMDACKNNPEDAIMVNTESTRLILDNINSDVKFIIPNTNSQYGTVEENILCSEKTPTNPISLYSITKCLAESLTTSKDNTLCLRLATVFGVSERMRDDLMINFFVKKCINEKKLDIFEPNFKRNFISIDNVTNALVFGLNNNIRGIFNVGDDSLNMTKGELAKKISQRLNVPFSIIEGFDPDKRNYNCSSQKIYDMGFRINIDFNSQINNLIKYYKN